jgi:fructose-1,6-bisphosphatase/inositol monophosphatase family enzyme
MFSDSERQRFDALTQATRFRVFGADCYAYGLLSAGHVELVAESNMAPHDFLALVPVVEGAGGMITDWQGNPLDLLAGRQVLATANPALHEQALARLDPTTAS